LLKLIEERSRAPLTTRSKYSVQHSSSKEHGWQIADSANFRVYHRDATRAEQVLQVAEETRALTTGRWLGDKELAPWSVRCDIYLHATGDAYCRATGAPSDSPGHSSIGAERDDASRIHSRRIDLRVDDPQMLRAVLPHEATHVVLAGKFGRKVLPRWADEGLAILSEPTDRIERHTRLLPRAIEEKRVFGVGQLLELDDYPHPHFMQAFYGQSASLVEYLSELKGPRVFVEFLRSAPGEGCESALRRHYGLRDYADLELRWTQAIFANKDKIAAENREQKQPRE